MILLIGLILDSYQTTLTIPEDRKDLLREELLAYE